MDNTETLKIADNGWLHGRLGTVVLWALLIALESSGQIATKVGGDQLGQMDFSLQWLQAVMLNPGVWVAIACYIGAFFRVDADTAPQQPVAGVSAQLAGICGGSAGVVAGVGRTYQRPALARRCRDHWRDCAAGGG